MRPQRLLSYVAIGSWQAAFPNTVFRGVHLGFHQVPITLWVPPYPVQDLSKTSHVFPTHVFPILIYLKDKKDRDS